MEISLRCLRLGSQTESFYDHSEVFPRERDPVLRDRTNVVVISNEAHRSQYGTKAKLVDLKDRATKEVVEKKYVFGYAKHMRDALRGASFIGFTSTPIEKEGLSCNFQ